MNKLWKASSLMLVALCACQPANLPSEPSPNPSASSSSTPEPTPNPSVSSTPEPTPNPSVSSTPEPTPNPSTTLSPEPSPTPSEAPTPRPTHSPIELGRLIELAGTGKTGSPQQSDYADEMTFPTEMYDMLVDKKNQIWFIGSNGTLGYLTDVISHESFLDGLITYRLYRERVKDLGKITGMIQDPNTGDFLMVQTNQNRIIRVNPDTGSIDVIAGTGDPGFNGDGQALDHEFNQPHDLAMDSKGNLFVTDTGNHLIWKITPEGTMHIFAGEYLLDTGTGDNGDGNPTYEPLGETTGDGGYRQEAHLDTPTKIFIGPDDAVYFLSESNSIRRIYNDRIDRYAGSGEEGYNGEGVRALRAHLDDPADILIGPDGLLYISDLDNYRIRRYRDTGEAQYLDTIAGNGRHNDYREAVADPLKAEMEPTLMAFDQDNRLLFYDQYSKRIRVFEKKIEDDNGDES